ncbi:P-loop containing nucleoside triphosphate hydrolase protein [Ceraceosorus guamensis]|uniref:P-loop containing nucleoside triphosphate hydrolase protein n=1 Tax=Ceraceosorus guamensis TaxID=1522189 RepID=A0A316W842_9BASI|nr:P-loop containing nucleoside triphosphate hydrolase protein [Ceraceosorus guamensis]PWN46057.1 P-loop containing nucleoside triphosphate hydrolase protein [Ceraceosorus guamensis]
MAPKKERYNAAARSSTAGGRTHKGKKASKKSAHGSRSGEGAQHEASTSTIGGTLDPNARLINPAAYEAQRAVEEARRIARKAPAGMSSKKRKRLEAYIAKGMAKDRKNDLLKKLSQSSAEVGDRSLFLSASTLGTGRARSGAERLEGINEKQQRKRRKRDIKVGRIAEGDRSDEEPEDEDEDAMLDGSIHRPTGEQLDDPERRARIMQAANRFKTKEEEASASPIAPEAEAISSRPSQPERPTSLGSALARGPDGRPIAHAPMRKRQKKRKAKTPTPPLESSDFDSSESSASEAEIGGEASANLDDAGSKTVIRNGRTAEQRDSNQSLRNVDDRTLIAAMRARGMDPATVFGSDFDETPSEVDEHDSKEELDEDADEDSEEDSSDLADGDVGEGEHEDSSASVWEGFSDDPTPGVESASSEVPIPKAEEALNHTVLKPPETPAEPSRRRGFKEWARAALGLGADPRAKGEDDASVSNSAHDEGPYKGPEPVMGLTQKVKDLMDQDERPQGPLGAASSEPLTPFAARYVEESSSSTVAIRSVDVKRAESIDESRRHLPILQEEDLITRTIMENMVTVLCGETGSGKTTQVPQFLYELGFGTRNSLHPGMVGVTQPRRVAALSMATRVANELSLPPTKISHQIRYDATVSPTTAIKFMTDGVLLRELAGDFLLSKYSAILIDEAHERSVNTDVLIGVLSRVVRLRAQRWIDKKPDARPLRLVIMSATLRVADFAENTVLFPTPPPIINVEARQHPVSVHFARRTRHDYLEEATKKVIKIHARLPPGGILVFLTGQQEIVTVCQRLERRFGKRAIEERRNKRARDRERFKPSARGADDEDTLFEESNVKFDAKEGDVEAEEMQLGLSSPSQAADGVGDLAPDVDDGLFEDDDALETDDGASGVHPTSEADLPLHLQDDTDVPLHILPLYSLLPSDKQMRVFEPPPEGTRLCVVATNVAETSLTIPGVSYVVDCGRSKERSYDATTGVQSFDVRWISKASAAQRAGRAGRTGPGHCYRLYSSAVFEDTFSPFSLPEILRTPVEGLVLQMHAMHIETIANFPFPTPPNRRALSRAERILLRLGALEMVKAAGPGPLQKPRINDLGRAMSLFPLTPRFAKLLVQGQQHGCLPYIVALVAALSVGDPFLREQALNDPADKDGSTDKDNLDGLPEEARHLTSEQAKEDERRKERRKLFFAAMNKFSALGGGASDTFRLLAAVGAYEYERGGVAFCERNFLRSKAMEEIHKLRAQLCAIVQSRVAPSAEVRSLSNPQLPPPTETQLKVLRQLLVSAYVDQVAVRADLMPEAAARVLSLTNEGTEAGRQYSHQRRKGAKLTSTRGVAYLVRAAPGQACFIHPTSTLFHGAPPPWIIFDEMHVSSSNKEKVWLKMCTRINPAWLSTLARPLCSFSKPAEPSGGTAATIAAAARLNAANGSSVGAQRDVVVVPTYGTGPACEPDERNSAPGWELPPMKAVQKLVNGRWVTNLP